ncbi:hypothetical protein RAS12_04180 [Achromobacter seleniivolatilans]|uniref:Uncharacterized protein n=1 Tax=Achromobacter seleniivolatilans TaxID=3047478 RepID=A0ABY9M3K5_9BURK|nr:hypothetical protein [Achromobacter sp. R39]WMD21581.1 hypothetical protein RAS12_04180 [Achromobacter sp. R39]
MDCSVEGKVAFADGFSYHFATVDAALAFADCVKSSQQPAQCAATHGCTQTVKLEVVKSDDEEEEEQDQAAQNSRPSGG